MKETLGYSKILAFSKLENRLFGGLSHTPQGVSALAQKLSVPRTSLYKPILSLRRRGLIEKEKIGKHIHWKKVSYEQLMRLSDLLFSKATGGQTKNLLHPEFFLRTGKETLMNLYENFAAGYGARVLGIQPNRAAESVLNTFPFERLVKLNDRIKKQKVIVEGLLQEDFIPFYVGLLKRKGLSIKKIFTAFGERMASTTYVPRQYINFSSEIIILPKAAYIFHWDKSIVIEILNQETVGLLRDLFNLAKSFGTKVDQNEIVRDYLEKISK